MLNRTVVNNAMLDPLQGFDTDVFVLDQATGNQIMVGRFTGFQWTVRNATEPYMEFNQRIPRLLDGEFQFGWVLEQGLIDTEIMVNIFGFDHLGREMRPDRSPRLQITVEYNAPALAGPESNSGTSASNRNGLDVGGELLRLGNGDAPSSGSKTTRNSQGRYHLQNCKVDSVTSGAVAGRQVVAVRLEGLCEGLYYEKLDNSQAVNDRAGALPTLDSSVTNTISDSAALGRAVERSVANWNEFFPNS
jgi:hypothetical protein